MPKMNTISWHKENLRNRQISLAFLIVERTRQTKRIDDLQKSIDKLKAQIEGAIAKGKKTFDRERFMKNYCSK